MKSWLKGGLIGASINICIIILLILINIIQSLFFGDLWGFVKIFSTAVYCMLIFWIPCIIMPQIQQNIVLNLLVLSVIGISLYFIIGAIIGLIIEKIKSKKEENE